MIQVKKAKKFVIMSFIVFISTHILYILVYHFVGTKEVKISHSYKQFLLQYTKETRLIVDSGSSSKHAIDTYALEKEFAIQTVNLGDNAGYPLSQKLIRIKKYIHENDIILLPLEWQYYSRKETHPIFTVNLLGKLNYYYIYPSFIDEFQLILHTPFIDLLTAIKDKYKFYRNQNNFLSLHVNNFYNNKRGDSTTKRLFDKNDIRTCDQYVLAKQLQNGFLLSNRFKQNIDSIKKLRDEGHQIIFTWPVVAGDDCYSKNNKPKLDKLILEIKAYLKQHNIPIIGDPYENKFLTKDRLDTYYHINLDSKKIRTQRLIEYIKQSKLISKKDEKVYKKSINKTKQNMLNLLDKTYFKKQKIAFNSQKVIFQNWSHLEKSYRWSKGKNSSILFKFNPKNLKGILSLHVMTLENQDIQVTINKKYIGSQQENTKDKVLLFKFDPKILKEINTISFHFPNAHKPNSKDTRVLAMALKSFMIE